MPTNRRRVLLLGLAALLVVAIAVWLLPQKRFDFPAPSEIASMDATVRNPGRGERTIVVPGKHYREILAALSPSKRDRFPSKWQVLGNLEIQTTDGQSIHVALYDLSELPDESVGAFAAGLTFESRTYYRGGNSARLKNVLMKANAEEAID